MRWMAWMSGRMIRIAVAALLTLSLGTPSVFAFGRTDEMRQGPTDGSEAAGRAAGEIAGEDPASRGIPPGSVPSVYGLLEYRGGEWTRAEAAGWLKTRQGKSLEPNTVKPDFAEQRELGIVIQEGRGNNATYRLAEWLATAPDETRNEVFEVQIGRAHV